MNKFGFVQSDKDMILSNYKKVKEELQNVYNKYGYKTWQYDESQKKELNSALNEFNSAKAKCLLARIRI